MTQIKRLFFLGTGCLCVVLGFVGAFVPLLPTVPFLLLAAYCFSKSSHRLHSWLLSRPKVGPIIQDWELHGVIQLKAKRLSTAMMLLLASYPIFLLHFSWVLKSLVIITITLVLIFIWTRPSKVPADQISSDSSATDSSVAGHVSIDQA